MYDGISSAVKRNFGEISLKASFKTVVIERLHDGVI
jgi:hypothetical protein